MGMRIVQIAATAGGDNNSVDTLYALTADGSLWRLSNATDTEHDTSWRKLPPPPVPEVAVP